jgi:hypothetical protein
MTYKEAIQEPDAAEWQKEIDKEHASMMQHKAWIKEQKYLDQPGQ